MNSFSAEGPLIGSAFCNFRMAWLVSQCSMNRFSAEGKEITCTQAHESNSHYQNKPCTINAYYRNSYAT
jgi:hypothetical protein